jgi:hypothetical protein
VLLQHEGLLEGVRSEMRSGTLLYSLCSL